MASQSAPADQPTRLAAMLSNCPKSIAIGTTIGAVLGGGFHALQGPTQVTIGQPDLKTQRLGMCGFADFGSDVISLAGLTTPPCQ